MGCCCAKPEDVQEEEGERTPLLTEKHLRADSVTGGDSPSKPVVTQDEEAKPKPEPEGEAEPEGQPADDAKESRIPEEDPPAPVDVKPVQIAECDEKMEAAVLRYHKHLNHFVELQKTEKRIREIYPEHNKDQTIVGCFIHVRNILGTRLPDVLSVNEMDPTCLQMIYKKEHIPDSVLSAVDAFNKATHLVKELLQEGPLLSVAVDDVIYAENVMRAEIVKMGKEKDSSVVNQCLDHYLYNIRQFYYIKTMLEKIKGETQSIHCQLQKAAQEISTRRTSESTGLEVPSDLCENGQQPEGDKTQPFEATGKEETPTEVKDTSKVEQENGAYDVKSDANLAGGKASVVEEPSDLSSVKETTTLAETKSEVHVTEQTAAVSAPEQTAAVSAPEQTGDVSAPEQTAAVSGPEQTGDVSAPERTAAVSAPEQTDFSAVEQTGDVSTAEQKENVSNTQEVSDIPDPDKTSDVRLIKHSLDTSDPDHTPDMSHDNLSADSSFTDQRTTDTTMEQSADMSADFRTGESTSSITEEEGEASFESGAGHDTTADE